MVMRKRLVVGNWKMNMTPSEAVDLAKRLKDLVNNKEVDVAYCVPYVDIIPVLDAVKGTNVLIGAQNVYFEEKGAFTGEISCDMLKSAGVSYVILGHSERREYFHETNEIVNKKLKMALKKGLIPIMCCGESLDQRERGITFEWIKLQIAEGFSGLKAEDAAKIVIAYEPIWAIGTGLTATKDQAEEVCSFIRNTINGLYGEKIAANIRILYGGSCNGKNAKELFSMPDIDGGLIGGASLKEDFSNVVNA